MASLFADCPSCGRKLKVPDDLRGKEVKCPSCGKIFTATESQPSAPPEGRQRQEDEHGQVSQGEPRRRLRPIGDDDDYDVVRPSNAKPGKIQAISIMTFVGGIIALLNAVAILGYTGIFGIATFGFGLLCCLWPGPYYGLIMGILATMKGSKLLGDRAHFESPPKTIAIMQIINIINFDVINCVLGIITLVFLNEPETRRYFRGR
ncbi:MAG: hypothetical protein ACJ8FY_23935 [Gemmataceae bacterium]